MAMSVFRDDIDTEDKGLIQLKYHHNRINGSDLWVGLGMTIYSPEVWRQLLQSKPELVEIGVFLVDPPSEITLEENGKPIGIRFHISHNFEGNEWSFKERLDQAPNNYTVST